MKGLREFFLHTHAKMPRLDPMPKGPKYLGYVCDLASWKVSSLFRRCFWPKEFRRSILGSTPPCHALTPLPLLGMRPYMVVVVISFQLISHLNLCQVCVGLGESVLSWSMCDTHTNSHAREKKPS